ncbi:hypothetical protein IEQ34_001020 [Dendrobium chrysotoxum]|uniref:Uncharacterized protein n=1 Tax=Dendrobium chrysotoxum TaxID=161865 RepID=A0AAV7HM50_DENCH|nr:hypothetical protein IEQ34_001020 [Dendrobium chrysotoxum]
MVKPFLEQKTYMKVKFVYYDYPESQNLNLVQEAPFFGRIYQWHQLLNNRCLPYLVLALRIHLKLLHLLELEKSDVNENVGYKSNASDELEKDYKIAIKLL